MMLQEKRRKLRCDVKVIKAEEWRTNKSTFEIENVEEKLTQKIFDEQSTGRMSEDVF